MKPGIDFAGRFRGLALICLVLLLTPHLVADHFLTVDLRVPGSLELGQVYDANLRVKTQVPVADGYAKLSLPYAFRVISGRTSYRGAFDPASELVLSVRFEVTGISSGTIGGKALAYFGESRSMFGKGQTLYCKVVDGVIVLSDKSPAAEEDAVLEAEVNTVALDERERTAWLGRRLQQRRDRAVLREQLDGARFPLAPVASTFLPENSSAQGLLPRGSLAAYRFNGHAGDRVWITVESEQFDPRLLVVRSDGTVVAEDDDSAGALNARVPSEGVFELSSTDTYWIVIQAHGESEGGEYRLKVENFTHLEPTHGSVLPASKQDPTRPAGPQAADVQLTGRVLYNSPSGPAPLRFALARLFADVPFGVDAVIATSQTDANGDVSFRVPEAHRSKTLYVVVYTQDAAAKIATVRDPLLSLDLLHSAEMTSRFTLPAASAVTFGNWNLAGTGQNGPFLVFDATVEGYLIATDVLGFTPRAMKVNFPIRNWLGLFTKPGDIDACYNCKVDAIGEIGIGELYRDSPDVVLHEYGHFISDAGGFLGSPPPPPDHEYPFTKRIHPIMAWNEGWATFLAVGGQNAHGDRTKTRYISRHPNNLQNYDLENGHDPGSISDTMAGDENEGSAQFVLWDLYDSAQDVLPVARSVDTVSLGLKTIFDVARNGFVEVVGDSLVPSRVAYLETFYDGLFQQRSFGSDQIAAIQGVFRDQYIRWEVPPAPPVGLKFGWKGSAIALQWQPGSPNSAAYLIEQRLPGQAEFKPLGSSGDPEYVLGSVAVGTAFRVTAFSANVARFSALLPSSPSQQITYSAPPPTITCTYALSSTAWYAPAGGGTGSVSVNTTAGCSWTAVSGVSWITITSGASGTGNGSVTYSVAANTSVSGRTGTLTIAGQTFTVTQAWVPTCSYSIAPTSASVPASGGPGGIAVTTTANCSWTATSNVNWITVTSGSSGTGNGAVTYSVAANTSSASRTGTLTIAGQILSMTQAGGGPAISSVVNAASFGAGMVPGGLATLFGKSLSPISGIEFPGGATSYKGVSVTVEGHQVPLLAVSNIGGQEQINFQVPFEFGVPAMARVEVNNNGSIATIGNVPLLRVQPGIFEWASQWSSTKYAAAVKLDGSVVGPTNPVSRGGIASLFLTGMGPVLPILQTGQVGPADPPAVTYLQPVVGVGGLGAQVLFSGYAPGFLGLYQINIVIPGAAPVGAVNLDIVVDGVPSQTSRIAVQ
jgi:uncharacterized protein (TIGR03437 family)